MTAADLGRREPARDSGLICGQVHARLAGCPRPPSCGRCPARPPRPRGSRAGRRAPPVLHLDLNPFNVLLGGDGALAGVLDWANSAAGHPVFDRARTWAILTLDPTARARRADPGWRLLCEGWVAAGGPRRRPGAGARLGV